jgi:GTP pyrophosphokinase
VKTTAANAHAAAAPILRLADDGPSDLGTAALVRARAFAEPLLTGQRLDTGEEALAHADGIAGHRCRAGDAGRRLPGLCR